MVLAWKWSTLHVHAPCASSQPSFGWPGSLAIHSRGRACIHPVGAHLEQSASRHSRLILYWSCVITPILSHLVTECWESQSNMKLTRCDAMEMRFVPQWLLWKKFHCDEINEQPHPRHMMHNSLGILKLAGQPFSMILFFSLHLNSVRELFAWMFIFIWVFKNLVPSLAISAWTN